MCFLEHDKVGLKCLFNHVEVSDDDWECNYDDNYGATPHCID